MCEKEGVMCPLEPVLWARVICKSVGVQLSGKSGTIEGGQHTWGCESGRAWWEEEEGV